MKTKKTSWLDAVAMPMIVAGFGLAAASTSVADHCPPTDVNGSGQVNIDDLLMVLEDWNTECDLSEDDNTPMNWEISSYKLLTPANGGSRQSEDGASFTLYDQNLDPSDPTTAWGNYQMSLGTLYKGPGANPSDVLTVSYTVDFSQATMYEAGKWPNYALFLTGYYDPSNPSVPLNYNTDYGLWYYADAGHTPSSSGGGTSNCVNGGPGTTVAELDLMETGSAQVDGQNVPGSRVNVLQITSHAAGDGNTAGQFISLIDKNMNATDGFNSQCANHPDWSQPQYQLMLTNDGNNYLGLDLDKPFDMTYTITQANMTIHVVQASNSVDVTFTFAGADPPHGVRGWENFQYFAVIASVNNGYNPVTSCGGQVSSSDLSSAPGHAMFCNLKMSLNGSVVEPAVFPAGNNTGFHSVDSDCSFQGFDLPNATIPCAP